MKITQFIGTKFSSILLSQIFFKAGWSKKLNNINVYYEKYNSQNEKFLNKFEIISFGLKIIYEKKIFSINEIIKNKNLKKFIFCVGSDSMKNFRKNFLQEFQRLNELIYAFHSMNLFYIDRKTSFLIENKIQKKKSQKEIIIFHCGGRDGLTIENEEYFLDVSFKINSNFKNLDIKHIWLNFPKKPISCDEVAEYQFNIIKNIIYVKKYKLEQIIICGFSMGGLISLKIMQKIKNDVFFINQKLLAYINIASFSNMIEVLGSLRPIKINHFFPCKILSSFASIASRIFDEKSILNWSIDSEKIFSEIKNNSLNQFICSLDFDEFITKESSLLYKIYQSDDFEKVDYKNQFVLKIIKHPEYESLYCIKIDNEKRNDLNHESCRTFFLNFILHKLSNTKNYETSTNQNFLIKLYGDFIKLKYIKNIIKT